MITDKINQIEKLITVPNVDKDPDGANNAMQILIHLTELRGLVDSAFLPSVRRFAYLVKSEEGLIHIVTHQEALADDYIDGNKSLIKVKMPLLYQEHFV
jgi:hypothetical protein